MKELVDPSSTEVTIHVVDPVLSSFPSKANENLAPISIKEHRRTLTCPYPKLIQLKRKKQLHTTCALTYTDAFLDFSPQMIVP